MRIRIPKRSPGFKAVTWNFQHGTEVHTLRRVLRRLRKKKVTLFLIQEATKAGAIPMLRKEGLGAFKVHPEFAVAWDPTVWRAHESRELFMSDTPYALGKNDVRWAKAAEVVLVHRKTGKTLDVLSYHLPAHVQIRNPDPDRVTAIKESIEFMEQRAAERDYVLYGGDDNVDEHKFQASKWRFMLHPRKTLRQIQAKSGTLHARRIDDFRIKGLGVRGKGEVLYGGGDHKVHLRTFFFKNL